MLMVLIVLTVLSTVGTKIIARTLGIAVLLSKGIIDSINSGKVSPFDL